MRILLAIVPLLALAGVAAAAPELGPQATVAAAPNMVDPARQGGDTIASATVVPGFPYCDSGTTVGYANDYDEACPYQGSVSPDVVYLVVSATTRPVNIDLCGSSYDTKLYVYDGASTLIACNDDFYSGPPCGEYVSKIENLMLIAGATYYVIVDGYGTASGSYELEISGFDACVVECPAGGVPENEPPLVPDYVDNWNGGCNTPPSYPFQEIHGDGGGMAILCGRAGWYDFAGNDHRDTDWYTLTSGGTIQVTIDAESPTYAFELSPQDCASVGVAQQVTAGACNEATMTISGYPPGATVWFWAGSTTFDPPWNNCYEGVDFSYRYVVWFSGLATVVATEATTWSQVKTLYE